MSWVADLKLWRTRQAEERLKQGAEYQNFDLVFCQRNGKPLHPHNIVRRDFHAIIRRSDVKLQKAGLPGLPQITFHGLRHIHATLLVASGVDVRTVSTDSGMPHLGSR